MATEAEWLLDISLFTSLDDDERAVLAQHIDQFHYDTNTTIFRDGDASGAMYFIRSGRVELWLYDEDKQRVSLGTLSPGEFFGELSLLDEEPRSATATAVADTELLVIDREDLRILFSQRPDAAFDVLAVLSTRLRETNQIVRTRATRNANEMIANKLSFGDRLADRLTGFSGNIKFVYLNFLWFGVWILFNLRILPGLAAFDPFPFGLLTMIVSLEAIFLSLFVLISQNRGSAQDRLRAELDYRVNLKAEIEIGQLHHKLDALRAELLRAITHGPQNHPPA